MAQDPPSFNSVEAELAYYKERAKALETDLDETKYVLEEFQLSSRELEEELEREIDTTEKRYNEIKIRNDAMRQEVEEWKEKHNQVLKESNVNINQMTRELETLRQQTDMFIKKERELEQNNDDLERNGRAAQWSLQEVERKYNVALERQAMLENEVSVKASLADDVQRLKDELRDANVELAVMKSNQATHQTSHGSGGSVSSLTGSASSGGPEFEKQHPRRSPAAASHEAMPSIRARLNKNGRSDSRNRTEMTRVRPAGAGRDGIPGYTPGHQNPIQMVQEMVGRVKSLEARLVSCRSLVTPLLQPPPSYTTAAPPLPALPTLPVIPLMTTPRSSPRNSFSGSGSSRQASPHRVMPMPMSKGPRRTSMQPSIISSRSMSGY